MMLVFLSNFESITLWWILMFILSSWAEFMHVYMLLEGCSQENFCYCDAKPGRMNWLIIVMFNKVLKSFFSLLTDSVTDTNKHGSDPAFLRLRNPSTGFFFFFLKDTHTNVVFLWIYYSFFCLFYNINQHTALLQYMQTFTVICILNLKLQNVKSTFQSWFKLK